MSFLERCKAFALNLVLLVFPHPDYLDVQKSIWPGGIDRSVDFLQNQGLSFAAPQGPESGDQFVCQYPTLDPHLWSACSPASDTPGCWLKGPGADSFDVSTDYEATAPQGVKREYTLTASALALNLDGVPNPDGKVFNGVYPGPRIQACWGDVIQVTVQNDLQYNGTTIHWHGMRQLGIPEMDGVNGVSQCPIAPSKSYTYTINTTQYGTTWYHSHYSLQYADGLLGPITVYGPTNAQYDEAKDPILLADWTHRSAYQDFYKQLTGIHYPKADSVLINGQGNYAGQYATTPFTTVVEKGKRYLLRIINTSLDTDYIFSIDNHNLTVVSTDFVPIQPYQTDNLNIAIGQRYQVILEANPNNDNGENPQDMDYWIRTIAAQGCSGFEAGNDPLERQGILRYNSSSTDVPTTTREYGDVTCKEEPYTSLMPVVSWTVPPVSLTAMGDWNIDKLKLPNHPAPNDNFKWFAFGDTAMWLDLNDPTILNLQNTSWDPNAVVTPVASNSSANWFYMLITAPAAGSPDNSTYNVPVAHPIHLHGHDFTILGSGTDTTVLPNVQLNFNNPPRRDTALIVSGGWIAIAFRTDNPGAWLLHCHIPWHASNGLALQIMERQADFAALMTPARLAATTQVCEDWNTWISNSSNWWDPNAPFQGDSGI